MGNTRMHANEADIDSALVQRLLAEQFPAWAKFSPQAFPSAGTDNAMYRLGPELVARLPRIPTAAEQVSKEQRWLPVLAPLLPLPIPQPAGLGKPGAGYPWHWSVYRWLEGEPAGTQGNSDISLATDLARFIAALHRIDPADGPEPALHNGFRGVPLIRRDEAVHRAIGQLAGTIDTAAALEAWEAALRAPAWDGPPCWIHGDLAPANLLLRDGALAGVIDFGCLGVGDPACDLLPAWNLCTGPARDAFRTALDVDDATWERGRGWALSIALIALPYYRETNPTLVAEAQHVLGQVLGG